VLVEKLVSLIRQIGYDTVGPDKARENIGVATQITCPAIGHTPSITHYFQHNNIQTCKEGVNG
jgi:hypothetical protein